MDKETEKALDELVDGAMDNGCDTNGAYTSMTDVADAVYKAYEMGRKSVRPEGIQIEERVYKDCLGVFCGMADVDSASGREMFDRLLLKLGVNVRPPQPRMADRCPVCNVSTKDYFNCGGRADCPMSGAAKEREEK